MGVFCKRETRIRKDELMRVAKLKHLQEKNCEKDYLLDALLLNIFQELDAPLVLKGGTALYKLFHLNRFSEDLDFTLNARKFDAKKTKDRLLKALRLLEVDGLGTSDTHGNAINIRFHLKGPLYNGRKESLCYILLNISHRERIVYPAGKELLISPYSGIPSFDVLVMNESEMMAEKIRAIMSRDKPRDIYDLWFLLKKGVRLDLGLINTKLKLNRMIFSKEEFSNQLEGKKNLWFEDLSGFIIGGLPDFEKVKNEIIINLNEGLKKNDV